jgi:hypothetical protein
MIFGIVNIPFERLGPPKQPIYIIFFTFFVLNIIFGPDKNAELRNFKNKKVKEKANELIEILPRGVLTFYEANIGKKLSAEEYKIVCGNTKIITQRAIMGANITDSKAFNLYTANGGTTGKYSVKWDKIKDKGKPSYKRFYGPPFLLQISGSGLVAPSGMFFNARYSKLHIGNFTLYNLS